MIGQTIRQYHITAKLGEGGMGEVYLAEDTNLKRQVALKFLPRHFSSDDEARSRFKREAQALAALNHPNIVAVYDVSEHDGQPFIAMEYVEGQSLKDLVESGDIDVTKAIDLAAQAADGLAAAHKRDIVHRDIKSENIVISSEGRVKIMDFGLATWKGVTKITAENSTLGTRAYMSPEQSVGGEVDHRTDLWSLGVVLYELVTRQLPFAGGHDSAIAYSIANEDAEPLARYKSGSPDELQRIISKCLAKNPDERYQSAADLATDLRHVGRTSGSTSSATHDSSVQSHKKSSKSHVVIGIGVIALAALILLLVRPWNITVEPSNEAMAVGNLLAVMYFDNVADPEDRDRYGEIAANLLITDLSESEFVKVVSSQRLFDILNLLGKSDAKRIDRATATEVAKSARARWMLQGSLLKTEPTIILTAQIVDVESGNAVASQRIDGAPGEDIFALVDRLTVEVKGDLSLPEAAKQETDLVIAEGTTHSQEAYRYYLSGIENQRKFFEREAEADFRKAIDIDSTFAMAYFHLAWGDYGDDPSESKKWISAASRHSKNSPKEHRLLIALLDPLYNGSMEEELAALEKVLAANPDEKMALEMLGSLYQYLGRYDECIRINERLLANDPLDKSVYNTQAYLYHEIGDIDKSITAINKYIDLAPDEPNPYDTRGDLYGYNGRLEEAAESFAAALARKPDYYPSLRKLGEVSLLSRDYVTADSCFSAMATASDPGTRSAGRKYLAYISAYQGMIQGAVQLLEEGIAADQLEKFEGPDYLSKFLLKSSWLSIAGKHTEALESFRQLIDQLNRYDSTWALARAIRQAPIQARIGQFEVADSIVRAERNRSIRRDSTGLPLVSFVEAQISLMRGDAKAALLQTENVTKADVGDDLFGLQAQAYLALGQPAEAIERVNMYAGKFDTDNVSNLELNIGVHYRLGQAYEQSGWIDKALAEYELFLDIWKDADDDIPMLNDAKMRVLRLKGPS